jgi:hypothetical protein
MWHVGMCRPFDAACSISQRLTIHHTRERERSPMSIDCVNDEDKKLLVAFIEKYTTRAILSAIAEIYFDKGTILAEQQHVVLGKFYISEGNRINDLANSQPSW